MLGLGVFGRGLVLYGEGKSGIASPSSVKPVGVLGIGVFSRGLALCGEGKRGIASPSSVKPVGVLGIGAEIDWHNQKGPRAVSGGGLCVRGGRFGAAQGALGSVPMHVMPHQALAFVDEAGAEEAGLVQPGQEDVVAGPQWQRGQFGVGNPGQ